MPEAQRFIWRAPHCLSVDDVLNHSRRGLSERSQVDLIGEGNVAGPIERLAFATFRARRATPPS